MNAFDRTFDPFPSSRSIIHIQIFEQTIFINAIKKYRFKNYYYYYSTLLTILSKRFPGEKIEEKIIGKG